MNAITSRQESEIQQMKMENILAKNITSAGEKAAYDAACKRLLANKNILAWIMKSCLEEYRDIEISDIAGKYIEGEPQIAENAVNPPKYRENTITRYVIQEENMVGNVKEEKSDYDLLTAEQAMAALKVPETEWVKYSARLKQ